MLKVHFTPPKHIQSWNFQLNNHWMESLDYRYFKIHTNSTLASTNADGSITIAIVPLLKEVPLNLRNSTINWLETTGLHQGPMCFRYVGAKIPDNELPHPEIELVPTPWS